MNSKSKMDWDICMSALKVVSQTEMCDANELKEHISGIEAVIGDGYYDGVGDELLKQIVAHLKSRLKESK